MKLHNLLPPFGKKHKKRRVGRGDSAGQGSHSGKGMSGERSRSGRVHYLGFEGGQMPLYRRLPKRGFTPLVKERYQEVNIYSLNDFKNEKEITPEILYNKGLIRKKDGKVKILGGGAIEVVLIVKAHKFSKRAKEEIIKKGGSAIEIGKELQSDKAPVVKEKPKKIEKKIEEKKVEKQEPKKEPKVEKLQIKQEKKIEEKKVIVKKMVKKEKITKAKKTVKGTEGKKEKITKDKKKSK